MKLPGLAESPHRLHVLQIASWLAVHRKEIDEAIALAAEALPLAERLDEPEALIRGHKTAGIVEFSRKRVATARQHWETALKLADEMDRPDLALGSLINLTVVAMSNNDFETANTLLERTLTYERQQGSSRNSLVSGAAAIHFAEIARNKGDLATTIRHLKDALAISYAIRHQMLIIGSLSLAGTIGDGTVEPEISLLLIAAAETARTTSGFIADAINDADEVRQMMSQVKRVFDRDRIDETLARGSRLSVSEAVALATSHLDALERATPVAASSRLPDEASLLTARERDVLRLLADGRSNQEIADSLFISLRTAQTHVANVLSKLKLGTRAAAVAYSVRHGLA